MGVIIPDPVWLHYFYCGRLAGAVPVAVPVAVPLREEMKFKLDPDDAAQAITPRTKMLVVTTPHNPTGSVLDGEVLQALADIAEKHDLLVPSDEIYEKIIRSAAGSLLCLSFHQGHRQKLGGDRGLSARGGQGGPRPWLCLRPIR